ncbi:MAG: sigma 54-interacting transcriptional regulator [Deltaproteobacteria bacterium]|nr:sigma 54-interacting transcriptional regulator [Deltaproteobacteria bacterium]
MSSDTTADLAADRPARRRQPARELGLVVVASPALSLGHCVPITETLEIGREATETLGGDGALSRRHCTIRRERSGLVVEDHASKNGTFVDGARVARSPLAAGSLLRAGASLLIVAPAPPRTPKDPLLVGVSEPLQRAREAIERLAPSALTVLLIGESGTGKELAAARLHALSGRQGALVPVNAAAITESLAESALFGHERGAFTGATERHAGVFEQAKDGTVFLDEIGELSPALQAKLLRVLEGGDYAPVGSTQRKRSSARVIAATHRSLEAMVEAGSFRGDLYARLAGAVVVMPPLRERRIDVPWLVEHFRRSSDAPPFSAEAIERLMRHAWPRNVRELRQLVDRLLVEHKNEARIDAEALGELTAPAATVAAPETATEAAPEPEDKAAFEAAVIAHKGNVVRLSKHYARTRKQIYRWCERFGIDLDRYR